MSDILNDLPPAALEDLIEPVDRAERPPDPPIPGATDPAVDAALDAESLESVLLEAPRPRLTGGRKLRRRRQRALKKGEKRHAAFNGHQRLLTLDVWAKSRLAATDFAKLVGVSSHTLYAWKKKFELDGPAGLMDKPRGPGKGSRLADITQRAILMLKEGNPEYGCERISAILERSEGLQACPSAVSRVLHEAGYELKEVPTRPHPDKKRRFERAVPSELWQTDIFTFVLKRQNRRVYLVAFMDDHSRFIVGYGLHASQSTALVLEALRAAITSYGTPQEILTDNGSQYVTWRGKSAFTKELEKRGIKQVVARPRRPQTLGKVERFWGTLWQECLEAAVFVDLQDARRRIGHFIDHYNFERVHLGIDKLVPADRFFGAAEEVKENLKARVAANALEIARQGTPKKPFYVTGQVGGKAFSLHAAGERVFMKRADGEREEVDLSGPPPEREQPAEPLAPEGSPERVLLEPQEEPAPGTSPLDEGLARLAAALDESEGGES